MPTGAYRQGALQIQSKDNGDRNGRLATTIESTLVRRAAKRTLRDSDEAEWIVKSSRELHSGRWERRAFPELLPYRKLLHAVASDALFSSWSHGTHDRWVRAMELCAVECSEKSAFLESTSEGGADGNETAPRVRDLRCGVAEYPGCDNKKL
jgi:hypothetical protein